MVRKVAELFGKMNSTQVTACQPAFNVLHNSPSMHCVAPPHVFQRHKNSSKSLNGSLNCQCMRLPKPSLKLTARASRYRQCTPVCVFGDKGKSDSGNEVRHREIFSPLLHYLTINYMDKLYIYTGG